MMISQKKIIWVIFFLKTPLLSLWLPNFSYRSTQHLVGNACLLSLVDQESKISNMFDIYNLSSGTLHLDREQLNNRNDTTQ